MAGQAPDLYTLQCYLLKPDSLYNVQERMQECRAVRDVYATPFFRSFHLPSVTLVTQILGRAHILEHLCPDACSLFEIVDGL